MQNDTEKKQEDKKNAPQRHSGAGLCVVADCEPADQQQKRDMNSQLDSSDSKNGKGPTHDLMSLRRNLTSEIALTMRLFLDTETKWRFSMSRSSAADQRGRFGLPCARPAGVASGWLGGEKCCGGRGVVVG